MGLINQAAFAQVQKQIQEANAEAILVAVTKTRPFAAIEELYQLGQRDFGENRVEELTEKAEQWQKKYPAQIIRWHFIGNLQSNKIKKLLEVPGLAAIHSLASLSHLEMLAKSLVKLSPEQPHSDLQLYLQVNTSHEDEKSGFEDRGEVLQAVLDDWRKLAPKGVPITGLMTMATLRTEDLDGEAKRCFERLHELALELQTDGQRSGLKLSMGMSNDYAIALKHGAHLIRIGSLLFS
jgi:pyridoxal phosphate enzyme (YggS family)